jgi:hypothetical protein
VRPLGKEYDRGGPYIDCWKGVNGYPPSGG